MTHPHSTNRRKYHHGLQCHKFKMLRYQYRWELTYGSADLKVGYCDAIQSYPYLAKIFLLSLKSSERCIGFNVA